VRSSKTYSAREWQQRRAQIEDGKEGIDFIRCRICGDRRRVISRRHLSKDEIERGAYMEEYGLSADELIAKAFRIIQSARRNRDGEYYPYGKTDWIRALKAVYRSEGNISTARLQQTRADLYHQGVWIFGNWDGALSAAGFKPADVRQRKSSGHPNK
jgi:hypothetical protein